MAPKTKARKKSVNGTHFFLESSKVTKTDAEYRRGEIIFSQGDLAETIIHIRKGSVKLSVVNESGKEAVVAIFGTGDFFGEGAMAGQKLRMGTATAMTNTSVQVVEKDEMRRGLHEESGLSDSFIAYMLSRNIRVEEDLIDQLFNSSEKRLARTLLLLARYGETEAPQRVLPKISQEVLAEMIGTTRSRVNFFMNKFRKLGFIEYDNEIRINRSLLSIVLHE